MRGQRIDSFGAIALYQPSTLKGLEAESLPTFFFDK